MTNTDYIVYIVRVLARPAVIKINIMCELQLDYTGGLLITQLTDFKFVHNSE